MTIPNNISDGFSASKSGGNNKEIKFTKIPDKEYMSLLEKGASETVFKLPASVTRKDHVPIACPDGKFELQADIYYKDTQKSQARPCIIFMHDWAAGKNPDLCGDRQGCFFALNGFVFIALYYRPPKYSPCPAALEDLKTAARWVRSKAQEYSIAADKIIAMGSSAGSQWAFMGATTNGDESFEAPCGFNEFSSEINLVMLHAAICNVVKDFKDTEMMQILFNCTYEQKPDRYMEFSPVCNVRKGMPPVIIINGDCDQGCSIEAARELRDKLDAVGGVVELVELPGRDHGSTGFPGDLFLKLNKYKDFIQANWS